MVRLGAVNRASRLRNISRETPGHLAACGEVPIWRLYPLGTFLSGGMSIESVRKGS